MTDQLAVEPTATPVSEFGEEARQMILDPIFNISRFYSFSTPIMIGTEQKWSK